AKSQCINQRRRLHNHVFIFPLHTSYKAKQPRRLAAITQASRVAEEKRAQLVKLVGYTVRFEDVTSSETKLKFMTDGMLLRTVHTGMLFGVVKVAQRKRREQNKIPLTVATMDVDLFSQYINKSPVLYLEGRLHHIQINYTKHPQSDYLQATLVTVFQIHQEAPTSYDILVVMTGQEEIEALARTCRDIAKNLPDGCGPMTATPLYASLSPAQQLRLFQPAPKGCRKVILSTNIAEMSITISGIKYIIDTGMVKAKHFNPESGLEVLAVQWVSKAQAWQRAGRAGREDSGSVYCLYTEDEFDNLISMTVCNLASVMLQLLALGIPNVMNFDFMSKPSPEAMSTAVEQLDLLGAVEKKDEQVTLTPLGKKICQLPPGTILLSPDFQCSEEVLTIVSLLSVDTVLYNPPVHREECLAARKKTFMKVNANKEWCRENFVNSRNMTMVGEVRAQLRDICLKVPKQIHHTTSNQFSQNCSSSAEKGNLHTEMYTSKCVCGIVSTFKVFLFA
uniref:RNA helicase n=1 Tax=Oncorhynchus kisutch TaxID=8019 RepID=A0A8C7DL06_ONCKI